MLRQVSSRNQRGKGGFKMKNALHICLLVSICVWLLYQMKHSHDKKRAFEERGSKVSFKGEDKRPDIIRFGRKSLPRIEEEEKRDAGKVGHGIRHEEAEDEEEIDGQDQEGSERESEHGGGEVTGEGGKKGQTKEVEGDHDEASHKAREISFKGDDASSEVVHVVQEVEHEEGSQEARERSFKADDASSAVAHVPQVNEPESESESRGMRNLDENELENTGRKDGETQNVANETLEDSSAILLLHNSGGNNSSIVSQESETVHNNTMIRIVNTNTTLGESETPKEQQPDPRIVSAIDNQMDREMQSKDAVGNAVELQTNLTGFPKYEIYFQKNSTTISVDLIEAQGNLTVKVDPTNVTVSQNETATDHANDGKTNAVKPETQGEEKPNGVIEQKADTIAKTPPATNEPQSGNSVHSSDREKNREEHNDQSNFPSIQNKVHNGDQEAAVSQ